MKISKAIMFFVLTKNSVETAGSGWHISRVVRLVLCSSITIILRLILHKDLSKYLNCKKSSVTMLN
jgi:hypothetical protein